MTERILNNFFKHTKFINVCTPWEISKRSLVSKQSGAFFPRPKQIPLGLIRVVLTVIPGLLVGASISKTIANFLEENDLFVPSDDAEDDD